MIEQQPKAGDRVRITYEATVDEVGLGGMRVVLRGATYFCMVPPGATVEVLRPPTLAERMTALADELESEEPVFPGAFNDKQAAARRIREALAADEAVAR